MPESSVIRDRHVVECQRWMSSMTQLSAGWKCRRVRWRVTFSWNGLPSVVAVVETAQSSVPAALPETAPEIR